MSPSHFFILLFRLFKCGSVPGQLKPKTIKLVFSATLLSMEH
jgi:hypothetical protein